MGTIFILLGLLIFCAHLFSAIFSKKRIPDVLFLVLIGILIGPVLGWVTPAEIGHVGTVFSYLTLVVILLDSGVDMKIDNLRSYWAGMVQVTFLSFVISMAVTTVVVHYMAQLDWLASMLMGSMVAGTGASIVIPMVKQMKVSDQTRTVLTLESAISAVLCIVVALAFMEGFKMGQFQFSTVAGNVLASFFMALMIGVVCGILWASLLSRMRKLSNSMFLTPAFVLVVYGVTQALGYSGAIAALAFGVVLGNAEYFDLSLLRLFSKKRSKMVSLTDTEKSFFKEVVFIFKTFFFIYIGICIPFTDMLALLYGLAIAAALFVARFILIAIVGRKNTKTDRLIVSIMIPKGLASAVLASIPKQINIAAGQEIIPFAERIECIVFSIIFFSILICSLLVLLSRKRIIDEDYKPNEDFQEVYDYE